MKTFKRVCIKSYTITDEEGQSLTIERQREYLTSPEEDGMVTVFSQYWVKVPVDIFAGEELSGNG